MAKCVNALEGFTLRDLLSENGLTLEINEDYYQGEDVDEYDFKNGVRLGNEEMLRILNMDDFGGEVELDENSEAEVVMPYDLNFEDLKTKMTDITKTGQVLKLVKKEGVGETMPYNSQVTVHYIGYLEHQDDPFDSTYIRGKPAVLRLNEGQLLPGLEIAIASMKKHETSLFLIQPSLAYMELGCMPLVPPNSEVLFAIKLLDYLDNGSADTAENLNIEEGRTFSKIIKRVQDLLVIAKDNFGRRKYRQAIREYKKAANWLEDAQLENEEEEREMKKVLTRVYGNLAVCYNIENMPRQACSACNRVPFKTAKTYFNHGRALLLMGEFTDAMKQLQIAHKMEPSNKETIKEIKVTNEKQKKYLDMEKRLWSNCLKNSKENTVTDGFSKIAKEFCDAFANDSSLLRQPLPEGLTPSEESCMREQAALAGLSVTLHTRYGKEVVYLSKPQY
ncbi:inactive peptidyl-prolyl cis-trans isomerase FKBP6 isoform X2 [Orussus abietinus]|nr:inactive peptidyl-prolyl cis-trans isomerase FKBP6 isoform X2 [Orussus abietinus]